MWRRKCGSGACAAVVSGLMFGAAAHAGMMFTNQGASLASWATVPGDAIQYTSVATPATATVSQGNVGAASGAAFNAMVETFTPSTSYTLGAIGISGSGGASATTIQMHLYDVTGKITSNNGTTQTGSGAQYSVANAPLVDLLGGGAGLSFSNPAQSQAQLTFALDNVGTSDQISLVAGRMYALEFWTPVGTSGFNWWRAGAVATDGQMMTSADASNTGTGASSINPNFTSEDLRITITSAGQAGGAPRTAALALYSVVPEPASIGLFALAGATGLLVRRRSVR